MKAAVIHGYGGPEVLKFEDLPDPIPGTGEVVVRVAASSVNPFDYKLRSGAMKQDVPLTFPAVLGVDVAGTVEAVGPGVSEFRTGEAVFAHAMGGYAQLCKVSVTDLARVPAGLELTVAASLPTVVLTGAQLAHIALSVGKGNQTLLVTGAVGMVGRSAVYAAKQLGATVIAGVLRYQMEETHTLEADRVIALDNPAAVEELEPLDAVANTIGGPTVSSLIAKIKDGGMFASTLPLPSESADFPKVKTKYIQTSPDPAQLMKLARAVQRREFTIPLGQSFPLHKADAAHAAAEGGSPGKIVLIVT